MALWKAETCRCHGLLIIFYIIKVVLDYKIIYILLTIQRVYKQLTRPPTCSCSHNYQQFTFTCKRTFRTFRILAGPKFSELSLRASWQELLSRLNILDKYSREDSRQFALTCTRSKVFYRIESMRFSISTPAIFSAPKSSWPHKTAPLTTDNAQEFLIDY
jgi:hypothetical protein